MLSEADTAGVHTILTHCSVQAGMAAGRVLVSCLLLLLAASLALLSLLQQLLRPLLRLLLPARPPLVVRTPEECWQGLEELGYTFSPHYLRHTQHVTPAVRALHRSGAT